MIELLLKGGPILMLIAALSVISLAVILWKISQLLRLGALRSGQTTDAAISQWCAGEDARAQLQEISAGLRALELVVTIAPLLGLLGTVLGMIDAFQALQLEGGNADPATLAGGIWAALLTTAAGMAVAIPVAMCLTWFDTIHDKMRHSFEDIATRIFAIKGPAA